MVLASGDDDEATRRQRQSNVTDESDIAVALVRTAFLIAFGATLSMDPSGYARSALVESGPGLPAVNLLLIRIVPPMAGIFTTILFLSYLWNFPLRFRRPLALLIDLLLVTSAMSGMASGTRQAQWLMPLYYLIVVIAAIWYRRAGAVMVACAASILDAFFRLQLPLKWWVQSDTHYVAFPWLLVSEGQLVPMLMIGIAVAYIVVARDREHNRAARMHRDLSMARQLQQNILPETLPVVDGYDLAVEFRPARVVGGDFYDAVTDADDSLFLCLGDMPGKSVYGLVHLSLLHSHVRNGIRQGLAPQKLAEFVNDSVYETLQPNLYAPLFVGGLQLHSGLLTFANCGHLPPLFISKSAPNELTKLQTGDIVIGATRNPEYNQQHLNMDHGDLLICYTDGIVEARNRDGQEFGTQRILSAAASQMDQQASAIAGGIMDANEEFSREASADDRTVLVLKRRPQPG